MHRRSAIKNVQNRAGVEAKADWNGMQACESLFAVLCCVWLPCIKMGRRAADDFDVTEVRVHRVTALNGMVMQMENRDSMALLAAIFTGQSDESRNTHY